MSIWGRIKQAVGRTFGRTEEPPQPKPQRPRRRQPPPPPQPPPEPEPTEGASDNEWARYVFRILEPALDLTDDEREEVIDWLATKLREWEEAGGMGRQQTRMLIQWIIANSKDALVGHPEVIRDVLAAIYEAMFSMSH